MNRQQLKELAEETVLISKNGSYLTPDNFFVGMDDTEQSIYIHPNTDISIDGCKTYTETKISVVNQGSVSAIFRLSEHGDVFVLNFASAKHPGGGFLNGAMAQEECLAYCSTLYTQLTRGEGPKFYINNQNTSYKGYTDGILLSEVFFFRNEDFRLVKIPQKAKVITCPAVNLNTFKYKLSDSENIMKNRMRRILYVAIQHNCERIVLGAFGCGVFGNSAETIAQLWKELLIDEGLKKYFTDIVFAVLDKRNEGNYACFKRILSQ